MRWRGALTVVVGVVGAAFVLGCGEANARKDQGASAGVSVSAPPANIDFPLNDFELVDQEGKPFKRSQLDGKVWIANFVFTSCPTVCPKLTQTMAALTAKYASDPDVRFVSISVDPENDTPEKLREFASKNGATSFERWSLLTGPKQTVDDTVLHGFKLALRRGSTAMELAHAERFCVVDRRGHVRGIYSVHGEMAEPEALDAHVRALLAEK